MTEIQHTLVCILTVCAIVSVISTIIFASKVGIGGLIEDPIDLIVILIIAPFWLLESIVIYIIEKLRRR